MRLPKFRHHQPATLQEACDITGDLGDKAQLLAGGTDLIVNMKKGVVAPENVVSLSRIQELKGVDYSNGHLRLASCTTVNEIARSPEVAARFKALGLAAGSLGSPLIRNLATVGGNMVTARPAADLPPPLISYGATIILKNGSGEREMPLDEFFRGPGETVVEAGEIVTHLSLAEPPPFSGGAYLRLGRRRALVIALVNVAAFLSLEDSEEGVIKTARIVLGAVAPIPMRAPSAEDLLIGQKPTDSLFKEASQAAARQSKPIDDFRGSAAYRRAMVAVLTRRALELAHQEAIRS